MLHYTLLLAWMCTKGAADLNLEVSALSAKAVDPRVATSFRLLVLLRIVFVLVLVLVRTTSGFGIATTTIVTTSYYYY